jgi:hypothetical protein
VDRNLLARQFDLEVAARGLGGRHLHLAGLHPALHVGVRLDPVGAVDRVGDAVEDVDAGAVQRHLDPHDDEAVLEEVKGDDAAFRGLLVGPQRMAGSEEDNQAENGG